ncbi:flagellar protein FliT [Vibrio sp.]|nr:flagellar protein FliT [Vibrio sp.]
MDNRLKILCDIDHEIDGLLNAVDINSEEINALVDKRDQILHEILDGYSQGSSLLDTEEWRQAIINTQRLVERMDQKTNDLSEDLKRFRHGNKSVQQYKKFL